MSALPVLSLRNTFPSELSPPSHKSPQFVGFQLQTLSLAQEEIIILAQKDDAVHLDQYSSLDKKKLMDAGGGVDATGGDVVKAGVGLMLPPDLDLYGSQQTYSLTSHHHQHHHHPHHLHSHQNPDLHCNRCGNCGGINVTTSSPSSASTVASSHHHHVHFLHPHLNPVQILDNSDGLLDSSIVTSACNNSSSTFTRNSCNQRKRTSH